MLTIQYSTAVKYAYMNTVWGLAPDVGEYVVPCCPPEIVNTGDSLLITVRGSRLAHTAYASRPASH